MNTREHNNQRYRELFGSDIPQWASNLNDSIFEQVVITLGAIIFRRTEADRLDRRARRQCALHGRNNDESFAIEMEADEAHERLVQFVRNALTTAPSPIVSDKYFYHSGLTHYDVYRCTERRPHHH